MKHHTKVFLTSLFVFLLYLNLIGQAKGVKECDVLYPIGDKNGNGGYINCKGDVIVKPQFVGTREFYDGVGVIHTREGDGFVDLEGKITIFEGTELFSYKFSEGLAFGLSKGVLGFIDKSGNVAIKLPQYGEVLSFSEGLGVIPINGKYYFMDKQGNIVIERGFDGVEGAEGFVGGMATVVVDEKWAVINRSGGYVIKPQDELISHPSDGLVNMQCGDTWVYVDKTGKSVLKVRYGYAGDFVEGLAKIEVNGKWGYMDKTGKIAISPQFDEVQEFSEGLAAVEVNDNLRFIDRNGKIVISTMFEYVRAENRFKNGLVYVYKGEIEGYINKKGIWIWNRHRG